ncbi:MAG: helix-turn-helix domain-containing protein [Candidatus Atabeyarchaeum deiterrae]
MELNALVEKLKGFGLMENEAKVYLMLVLKGPLRPSEISENSGVARAEVHRHLRSLQKTGFCVVVASEGKRYSAIPPDVALGSVIEEEENRRDLMTKKKEDILSKWNATQHPIVLTESWQQKLQIITDGQVALERGIRLIAATKSLARMILHEMTLRSYFSSRSLQRVDFLKMLGEGDPKSLAEMRVLLVSTAEKKDDLRSMLANVEIPSNIIFKFVSSLVLESLPDALIIDENDLLIHIVPTKKSEYVTSKGRQAEAIVTNVSSMIKPFIIIFDENWDRATGL